MDLLTTRSGGNVFGITVTKSISYVRKLVVLVIGGTILIVGMIMIVTPGPGVLVIAAGLGVLAVEFVWARTLLRRAKEYIARQTDKMRKPPVPPASAPPTP